MKLLSIIIVSMALTACGGSSSGTSSTQSNDVKLLGTWNALGSVRLTGDSGCTTLNGQSSYFYVATFRADDFDIAEKRCVYLPINVTPAVAQVWTTNENINVKYNTGGTGTYSEYSNGVLVKSFIDMDTFYENGSPASYTTYWTDGITMQLAGIPDCLDGTSLSTSNARCVPSANILTFTR